MSSPNIGEIVERWLKANGYDGLCHPGECGCLCGELMPCIEPSRVACIAGYKGPPGPDGGEWAVYPTREAVEAAVKDTEKLDEHPDGYDGPCFCKVCMSYGD